MKHLLLCLTLLPGFATAGPISFDGSWKDVTFRRYDPTTYTKRGGSLAISGTGTSSMIYKILSDADRDAMRAAWTWSAGKTVPATDLSQKGGEDRNLALYFVFTDPSTAKKITPSSRPSRLLGRKSRILVYAWGDNRSRGTVVRNPYDASRGAIYLLRPSGTGSFDENRDLAADYKAAFGEDPGKLVGVAIAADSDDTGSELSSTLANLTLE